MKSPVLESLFNSEDCEIFKTTYFEEHLRGSASKNVFAHETEKNQKLFIRSFNFTFREQVFSTSVSENK